MTSFTYTAEFQAPPAAVWPYLEDSDKIKQWMEGVVDDRSTSDPETGLGATFEMDIKEGRQVTTYQGEITKYEFGRVMEVKMVGGCGKEPMTMFAEYRLSDIGSGRTRLDYCCRCEKPSGFFMRLMMPLFKIFGRQMVKKFMRNLGRLVEQPSASAGA